MLLTQLGIVEMSDVAYGERRILFLATKPVNQKRKEVPETGDCKSHFLHHHLFWRLRMLLKTLAPPQDIQWYRMIRTLYSDQKLCQTTQQRPLPNAMLHTLTFETWLIVAVCPLAHEIEIDKVGWPNPAILVMITMMLPPGSCEIVFSDSRMVVPIVWFKHSRQLLITRLVARSIGLLCLC